MRKEKLATKICKHCKTEIPHDAKVCPQCRKKQGPSVWLIAIIVVVVIALIGSCVDGSKNEKPAVTAVLSTQAASEPINETTTTAETTAAEKTDFNVGEVADINGIQVSLVSTTESNGSDFLKPDDGNVFLLCEFEIMNGSKKDITVSSLVSFEAYCDDYSINLDLMGLQAPEAKGKKQLDGSVASGKKMNGIIAYQVPKDWKTLEIKFSPSFWSNKAATFIATK